MRYLYTYKAISDAVKKLASGTGDLRIRFQCASADLCSLHQEDFPLLLQHRYERIITNLNKLEPVRNDKGEIIISSLENTIKKIDINELQQIAEEICDLSYDLQGK